MGFGHSFNLMLEIHLQLIQACEMKRKSAELNFRSVYILDCFCESPIALNPFDCDRHKIVLNGLQLNYAQYKRMKFVCMTYDLFRQKTWAKSISCMTSTMFPLSFTRYMCTKSHGMGKRIRATKQWNIHCFDCDKLYWYFYLLMESQK